MTKRIVLETESGKTQDFGPTQIELQARGGYGKKPGQRTRFVRLVPAAIELVNWDEIQ